MILGHASLLVPSRVKGQAITSRWGISNCIHLVHQREHGLLALADGSLLHLDLFVACLSNVVLEVLIGGSRFHDLLDLVFCVLNNLVGSFFLSLKELDTIVESDHIKLDFLTALTDLRHRDSLFHSLFDLLTR